MIMFYMIMSKSHRASVAVSNPIACRADPKPIGSRDASNYISSGDASNTIRPGGHEPHRGLVPRGLRGGLIPRGLLSSCHDAILPVYERY